MSEEKREKTQEEKKRLKKKILLGALSVVLAGVFFLCGMLCGNLTATAGANRLTWAKEMIQKYYYREISDEEFYDATMDGLFGTGTGDGILDRYSAYYSAEENKKRADEQAGDRSGLGITISYRITKDKACLYRVEGNSPAEKAGLRAGMYLLGYGDDEESLSYETDGFVSFVSTKSAGESFCVSAATSADGEGVIYTVAKAEYKQNYVFYADAESGYRFVGENADKTEAYSSPYDYLDEETAVIRLDSFAGDAATQFASALKIMKERGKTHLVLDLRNDGGGQMRVLNQIASYLCKNAPEKNFAVATAVYRDGQKEIFSADKNRYDEYLSGVRVSVLANYNTASASEALMGAMLDYGTIGYGDIYLADIGGVARTYGKGIMQATYSNALTGEAIKLTVATINWPVSGYCLHDRGILPEDGAIAVTASEVDYSDGMLRSVCASFAEK